MEQTDVIEVPKIAAAGVYRMIMTMTAAKKDFHDRGRSVGSAEKGHPGPNEPPIQVARVNWIGKEKFQPRPSHPK